MYSLVQDAFTKSYASIQKQIVNTNTQINQVEVKIDTTSYSGFTSQIGGTAFGASAKWQANKLLFHYPAEHTVNNKRYDFEMNVYHQIYFENKASAASSKEEETT